MSYFNQDLKDSEVGVQEIIDSLTEQYKCDGWCVQGVDYDKTKAKDIGIRLAKEHKTTCATYEVKEDYLHHDTGNLAIECSCNGKVSGINATTADYWVFIIHENHPNNGEFGCHKICAIAETAKVKKLLKNKSYRRIPGGDGNRAQMYLVPSGDFVQIAHWKFSLKDCTASPKRHQRRIYN